MIVQAKSINSADIAFLHRQTISKGFLPKLGLGFLTSLYRFLIRKELVLVYKEEEQILGFVSCALSSKGIMKRFLFSSPAGIFKLMLALLKNPKLISPLLETYRAPSLSQSNFSEAEIPKTELLSISVSPQAQKGGIGSQLLDALEAELKSRGIDKYKVIAGEKLVGANKFYIKNGFVLARQITIHGNDVSNVYVKEINSIRF
jgi:ribosomal protein S18 acetylase RimI-like enzyme